jgi:hypothetical protein
MICQGRIYEGRLVLFFALQVDSLPKSQMRPVKSDDYLTAISWRDGRGKNKLFQNFEA